ncbi:LacI family DNA-binding transcriptional regulator [Pseudonocardia nigra]|uniref:LacI family DNA-binding transcriptional regulator n=1 Tax=Pseudonocardia nigra TaxID=1921578 RepID=UPI001C5EFAE0|nr:LacI family DNA-binding transcriptional regulator [Pseudonocardia nigra]
MRSEGRTAPTIQNVAAAAGVSIASVSRVLNGLTTNEDTIRRVREAVAEVGYVTNAAAKSLKTRQTGQIAFAMENIGNAAYLAMVRAIQPVLRAAGYRLLLHSTNADVDDEIEVLRSLGQRYVDGLVLCPLRVTDRHAEELRRAQVPVVVIGQLPDDVPADNVRADSRTGAGLAVRHLVGTGRRRIALVDGPLDTVPGRARYRGYVDGLRACGLDLDDRLVEFTDFEVAGGAAAMGRVLQRADVDAVFAANDLMALGAMQAVRTVGREIPGDVAVVGMDDTDLAETAWPPLTSVSLGSHERGRLAADLLLQRLADGSRPFVRTTVPPRLQVRASSSEGART